MTVNFDPTGYDSLGPFTLQFQLNDAADGTEQLALDFEGFTLTTTSDALALALSATPHDTMPL